MQVSTFGPVRRPPTSSMVEQSNVTSIPFSQTWRGHATPSRVMEQVSKDNNSPSFGSAVTQSSGMLTKDSKTSKPPKPASISGKNEMVCHVSYIYILHRFCYCESLRYVECELTEARQSITDASLTVPLSRKASGPAE